MESVKQLIESIALCWFLNPGCCESLLLFSTPSLSVPLSHANRLSVWGEQRKKCTSWVTFHTAGGAGLYLHSHLPLWGKIGAEDVFLSIRLSHLGARGWCYKGKLLLCLPMCVFLDYFFLQWCDGTSLLYYQTPTVVLSTWRLSKLMFGRGEGGVWGDSWNSASTVLLMSFFSESLL